MASTQMKRHRTVSASSRTQLDSWMLAAAAAGVCNLIGNVASLQITALAHPDQMPCAKLPQHPKEAMEAASAGWK